MILKTVVQTPVHRAVLLALLGGVASSVAFAQTSPPLTESYTAAGAHPSAIDTSKFNKLEFIVNGGGGGGGGSDSAKGGDGAAGSQVRGVVQVGAPYSSVALVVADGGKGTFGGSGGGGHSTERGIGGAGDGAGGNGGLNVASGGGGGGGGASSLHLAQGAIWVRAGGGGGGAGGSTAGNDPAPPPPPLPKRVSYNGVGMNADVRYVSALDTTAQTTTANPTTQLTTPSATLDNSAACASSAVGADGNSATPTAVFPAADGGGGGGNGGSYSGGASTVSAHAGRDRFWPAEGGVTGRSCAFGPTLELPTMTVNAGGSKGLGSSTPTVVAGNGASGSITLIYSYDPARVPTIPPTITPDGKVSIDPPTTLPPGNTPQSYEVTCTTAGGLTATGSGPAPGPVTVSPLTPEETYTCTTVAQLQDGSGTPTIKTLPSPPQTFVVPAAPDIQANDDQASTTPGTAVEIDVAKNDTATGTTIDSGKTTIVTPPKNGTAIVNPNGSITYTPNVNFTGPTDEFDYSTCDAQGLCKTAHVTVTVSAVTSPGSATAIPTLSEWGVMMLGLLLAGFGLRGMRRRD